jgi:hypothetical protein
MAHQIGYATSPEGSPGQIRQPVLASATNLEQSILFRVCAA